MELSRRGYQKQIIQANKYGKIEGNAIHEHVRTSNFQSVFIKDKEIFNAYFTSYFQAIFDNMHITGSWGLNEKLDFIRNYLLATDIESVLTRMTEGHDGRMPASMLRTYGFSAIYMSINQTIELCIKVATGGGIPTYKPVPACLELINTRTLAEIIFPYNTFLPSYIFYGMDYATWAINYGRGDRLEVQHLIIEYVMSKLGHIDYLQKKAQYGREEIERFETDITRHDFDELGLTSNQMERLWGFRRSYIFTQT